MATIYVNTSLDYNGLTSNLGFWLWNALLVEIPMDTGNLRASFKMRNNSQTMISYFFDDAEAYYVDYLEEGIGFVTKHKDFIKRDMVLVALQELVYFIKTGKTGLITTKPTVVLRHSQYASPIGYEKKILKYHNQNVKHLTGDDRKNLSRIMYRSVEDKNVVSFSGRRPRTLRQYKRIENSQFDYFYIDEKDYLTGKGRAVSNSLWR